MRRPLLPFHRKDVPGAKLQQFSDTHLPKLRKHLPVLQKGAFYRKADGEIPAIFLYVREKWAGFWNPKAYAVSLADKWREAGYYVISMRDDFKTIYGKGVEKSQP